MNIAEFQSRLINELDKVVAGAEALMMDESARTKADFARLKTEIQGLLDVVTDFERMCFGEKENSLKSVKETLAALRRTVAEESPVPPAAPEAVEPVAEPESEPEPVSTPEPAPEAVPQAYAATVTAILEEVDGDELSFGFEVLPAGEAEAELPEAVAAVVEEAGEAEAVEAATAEKPKEPELGLFFDEESAPVPEPMPEPTPEPVVAPMPEARTEASLSVPAEPEAVEPEVPAPVPESEPMPAPEPEPEPEPAPSPANELYEAIKQESMAQFTVKEEDQPQSYITQLTAMAQAQVKPGEQDMSGVAVSSTARPDTAPEPVAAGDSLMDSLRSTRANLHGGQLRTMVDKFKAPQTIYDIQHTRPVDLKMTIGVNEKYLLTQELFSGNIKAYGEAVSRLNEAEDATAASALWQTLCRQHAWDENSLAYATFYDLLKRRFPELG